MGKLTPITFFSIASPEDNFFDHLTSVLKTENSCLTTGGFHAPHPANVVHHDTGHEVIQQKLLELLVPGRMFNGVI